MKILAVDTSTTSGSVALTEDSRILCEWTLQSAQTHNRRLLKSIDTVLNEVDWTVESLDGFAVTIGPGSFTGLRIGLTTIKTLAWTMRKPFAGIPTLDALAAPLAFSPLPVCCILNAYKKEVFFARYEPDEAGNLERAGSYRVLPPEGVLPHVPGSTVFCGDGWLMYREFFRERLGTRAVEAPAPFHILRAGFVGYLAHRKFIEGAADDPVTSVPLYIRPSEAELNNPHLNPNLRTLHS